MTERAVSLPLLAISPMNDTIPMQLCLVHMVRHRRPPPL